MNQQRESKSDVNVTVGDRIWLCRNDDNCNTYAIFHALVFTNRYFGQLIHEITDLPCRQGLSNRLTPDSVKKIV